MSLFVSSHCKAGCRVLLDPCPWLLSLFRQRIVSCVRPLTARWAVMSSPVLVCNCLLLSLFLQRMCPILCPRTTRWAAASSSVLVVIVPAADVSLFVSSHYTMGGSIHIYPCQFLGLKRYGIDRHNTEWIYVKLVMSECLYLKFLPFMFTRTNTYMHAHARTLKHTHVHTYTHMLTHWNLFWEEYIPSLQIAPTLDSAKAVPRKRSSTQSQTKVTTLLA